MDNEQNEQLKAVRDMVLFGAAFFKDGKRVDPSEVFMDPPKDAPPPKDNTHG